MLGVQQIMKSKRSLFWVVCVILLGVGIVAKMGWRHHHRARNDEGVNVLVGHFFSGDAAEWREAAINLARAGREGLDALASNPYQASMLPRLEVYLSVALLKTVGLDDIKSQPKFYRIARPHFDRAFELSKVLEKSTAYDSGEMGLRSLALQQEEQKISAEQQALKELEKLQGYAVPEAVRLLKSDNKFARVYAAKLLGVLNAKAAVVELEPVVYDGASVSVFHGCYFEKETVGSFAQASLERIRRDIQKNITPEQAARANPQKAFSAAQTVRHQIAYEVESYILALQAWDNFPNHYLLMNGVRQESRAFYANSWDEWWIEARPIWRLWWENEFNAKEQKRVREQEWNALLPKNHPPPVKEQFFPATFCLEHVPSQLRSGDEVRNCLLTFDVSQLPQLERDLLSCLNASIQDHKRQAGEPCVFRLAKQSQNEKLCYLLRDQYAGPLHPYGQPACFAIFKTAPAETPTSRKNAP